MSGPSGDDVPTFERALGIMGVGALFRYHGQVNALGRLQRRPLIGMQLDSAARLFRGFRR